MKIALVGATGNAGTRLISELARRRHHVTAIARHPEKLQGQASVSPVSGDVQTEKSLATVLAGHDAVIDSVKFLPHPTRAEFAFAFVHPATLVRTLNHCFHLGHIHCWHGLHKKSDRLLRPRDWFACRIGQFDTDCVATFLRG